MSFQSFSRLNFLLNQVSGNYLPITADHSSNYSIGSIIYMIVTWLVQILYILVSLLGFFYVSKEKVLKDGMLNIFVCSEIVLLGSHMYRKKDMLHKLIGKFESLLAESNDSLKESVVKTVQQLDLSFKIYVFCAVSSVIIWTTMPLVKIFKQDQFFAEDFSIPAVFSSEPFSAYFFICGNSFIILGSTCTILKKVCFDIYMSYMVLFMTGYYKYLRIEIAKVIENSSTCDLLLINTDIKLDTNEKLRTVIYRHGIVIQTSIILKKIFSINVGVLYVNLIFRLCFLAFMILGSSTVMYVERCLVSIHAVGLILQIYMICFCVQQLLDTSTEVSQSVFHEKWYDCGLSLGKLLKMFIMSNKLECRLSSVSDIDLTMPCFAKIIHHAYTVCLFFLKIK